LLAQVFALSDLSRKNSNAEPWKSLVPDLVTTLTTAPPARPNSAEYALRLTWNSCTASWLNW